MVRFSLVTLFVEDPFGVADWYREHMGLAVVDRTDRFVRLADRSGTPCLAFHAGAPVQRAEHVQLHFEVADVDADHARLAARGVAATAPPDDKPWAWRRRGSRRLSSSPCRAGPGHRSGRRCR